MRAPAAILLFPVRPSAATKALGASPLGYAAPLLPVLPFAGYLLARGVSAVDAAAAAGGLLLLVLGTGLGGLLGCYPGRMLLQRPFAAGRLAGPCLTFAAWTGLLFFGLLLAGKLVGAGPSAALFAALFVLVWGTFSGIGVLTADDDSEPGRALVASCCGVAVALMGLWLGLAAASATLVAARPAPVADGSIAAGDFLLVRVTDARSEGDRVFLTRGREGLVAHVGADDRLTAPEAAPDQVGRWENWTQLGRIFFRFGGPGGGCPVP